MSSSVFVLKNGTLKYPWQARCKEHTDDKETYLIAEIGAVAFNTRGVGNRTWELAMLAALSHWNAYHSPAALRYWSTPEPRYVAGFELSDGKRI